MALDQLRLYTYVANRAYMYKYKISFLFHIFLIHLLQKYKSFPSSCKK